MAESGGESAPSTLRFRVPFSRVERAAASRSQVGQQLSEPPHPSTSLRVQLRATRPIFHPQPPRQSILQSPLLTDTELVAMDEVLGVTTPTPEKVSTIQRIAATKLGKVDCVLPCAVCEMAFAEDEIIPVPLSDLLLRAMNTHLSPTPRDKISQHVMHQYDASDTDPRLSGILLFPPGVSMQDRARVLMCATCHDCLNKSKPTLPRMAIANGNFIGWYDNEKLSWLDEQMIALLSPCVSMTSVAGGKQRCIRSHHYIVKNTQGPPIAMLAGNLPDRIRVAMVGAMTPEQIVKCKKRYTIDVPRCRTALAFLSKEYPSYRTEKAQREAEAKLVQAAQVSIVTDRTQGSVDGAGRGDVEDMEDTTSYGVPYSTRSDHPDIESQWIEERTALLDNSAQPSDFFYRKSNVFESSTRWRSVTEMFPLLFPGGRGGPAEPRKQQYSLRTWVNRCLRLHGNRFERHEVFLLLAFDYVAQEAARKRMYIRLKASTDAVAAGRVTRAVLIQCIEYRRHLEEASAKGLQPQPPSEAISTVLKLQRGIYAGEEGYYGSDKSRTHARNDIFGYISRLGPLQLFFTISPDSAGTYTIGARTGMLNSQLINHANAHLLPSRAARRATATSHPYQCAMYFEKSWTSLSKTSLAGVWPTTDRSEEAVSLASSERTPLRQKRKCLGTCTLISRFGCTASPRLRRQQNKPSKIRCTGPHWSSSSIASRPQPYLASLTLVRTRNVVERSSPLICLTQRTRNPNVALDHVQ